MPFKNQNHTYGWVSIALHWTLAIAVLVMFILGLWMVELDYYSTWYHDAPHLHKSVGVLLVLLMLVRLIWNLSNPKPVLLNSSFAHKVVAHTVHMFLYLLVFLLGISGYLISTAESQPITVFNWFDIAALIEPFSDQADMAGLVHKWLAYTLIGLVILHLAAALKHHFLDKDNTLKRMLKPLTK